jgi:hypothetical protein
VLPLLLIEENPRPLPELLSAVFNSEAYKTARTKQFTNEVFGPHSQRMQNAAQHLVLGFEAIQPLLHWIGTSRRSHTHFAAINASLDGTGNYVIAYNSPGGRKCVPLCQLEPDCLKETGPYNLLYI